MDQGGALLCLAAALAFVLVLAYQCPGEERQVSLEGSSSDGQGEIAYGHGAGALKSLIPDWSCLPGQPIWPYERLGHQTPSRSFQTRSAEAGEALGRSVRDARQAALQRFKAEVPEKTVLGSPPEGFLWRPSYEGVPVAFSEENLAETYQPAPRLWARDLDELYQRWWQKPRENLVEPTQARQAWIQLALQGVATSRKDPYTRLLHLPVSSEEGAPSSLLKTEADNASARDEGLKKAT